MKFRDTRLYEALDYLDEAYVAEVVENLKVPPAPGMPVRKHGQLRYILALAACLVALSALIPVVSYVLRNFTGLPGLHVGDTTAETAPPLTEPETPPEETAVPAPDTKVDTEHETTAPLYDGTTAPREIEHNGSYGLEYKMNEDGKSAMLFHRGICTDEDVIVASVWNGVPVTVIGEAAFADYTKYKTVTIPESVTVIDMRAFKNCTGLESVVLHDGISFIGADAFENCALLKEIVLPRSLEWIQTGLFTNCIGLQKVTIGNEVERIVFDAFYDCSALRELHYLGTKAEWNAIEKDLNWNRRSAIEVVRCSDGDLEVEPYVEPEPEYDGSRGLEYEISKDGKYAVLVGIGTCTDKDIVTATTYNGLPVTEISYAFWKDAGDLTGIHFSKHISEIGLAPDVMPNNTLQTITADPANTTFKAVGNCLIDTKNKRLMLGCAASVIPDDGSVETIFNCAFANVKGLITLTIPEGVKSLGYHAFANCSSLRSITLPNSLGSISEGAFKACTSLETIDLRGIEKIEMSAFEGCSFLKSVSGTENLTAIDPCAFKDCTSLAEFKFGDKLTLIDSLAFKNCASLKSIDIPESVTEIGQETFKGCSSLESVTIRGAVKSLYAGVFGSCSSLKNVTLNDGIKTIAYYAFEYCSSLESITLPAGLTTLGEGAFNNCTALRSIIVPAGVTTIGKEALTDCTSLTYFNFKGTTAEWIKVTKETGWNRGCPFTVIHCSDGDIEA